MSVNNGKITAPVGMEGIVGDIEKALGVSSGDLGTLCTSDRINIWAKYKPVRYASQNTLSQLSNNVWKADSQFNGITGNPAWWWGDYDFGIDFSNAYVNVTTASTGMKTALETLATKIDGRNNGWVHKKPRGLSGKVPNVNTNEDLATQRNEWYREIDFHLYNHRASSPISGASLGDNIVQASVNGDWHISVGMREAYDNGIDSRDYIFPWDVLSLWANKKTSDVTYNMYKGIAIYKVVNGSYTAIGWVTGTMEFYGRGIMNADATSADVICGDTSAEMKLKNNASYVVLPFLCNKEVPQPTNNGGIMPNYSTHPASIPTPNASEIYTCPYVDFMPFTAIQSSTTQMIGKPTVSNKQIAVSGRYSATVSLDATDTSYYIGGTATVQVMVVNQNYSYGDTLTSQNSAYSTNPTSITVAAGGTATVATITSLQLDTSLSWRVIVWVNGQYQGGVFSLRQPTINLE